MENAEIKLAEKENESTHMNAPVVESPKEDLAIDKDKSIAELVDGDDALAAKLRGVGLGCAGCPMSQFETLEQGARTHGMDPDELIRQLNAMDEGEYEDYD